MAVLLQSSWFPVSFSAVDEMAQMRGEIRLLHRPGPGAASALRQLGKIRVHNERAAALPLPQPQRPNLNLSCDRDLAPGVAHPSLFRRRFVPLQAEERR